MSRDPAHGFQNDGAGALWCAVAKTKWGQIPGKAKSGTCWFPYGGKEHTTNDFTFSSGTLVDRRAGNAHGSQNDGAGALWCAVADTRWGKIPGKAQGSTCWYAYGGKEHTTKDFQWLGPHRAVAQSSQQLQLDLPSTDDLKQLSKTMVAATNTIGAQMEALAKERRGDGVVAKVRQLETGLKRALETSSKSEEKLAAVNAKYKNALADVSRTHTQDTEKLHKCKKEQQRLHAQESRLTSEIRDMQREIDTLEQDHQSAKRQAQKEEQRRVDGLTDLIPGVGLIGGLITGRYERCIPGHSAINAAVSLANQRVEKLYARASEARSKRDRSQTEKRGVQSDLQHCQGDIREKERALEKLSSELDMCDKATKYIGKMLTASGNVRKNLQLMDTKMVRLVEDIDLLRDCDMLEHEEFKGLLPLKNQIVQYASAIDSTAAEIARLQIK